MSSEIDEKLLEKLRKIARLAEDKANENEAAVAAEMLQELLLAHNLTMAALEQGTNQGKARTDKRSNGGLYRWQRLLWDAIAQLHFCVYWAEEHFDPTQPTTYDLRKYGREEAMRRIEWGYSKGKKTFRHRLLGRDVNVLSSELLAEYLQDVIERLARDYVNNDPKMYYIPDAIAYREGIAHRLVERLNERRREQLREEAQKAAEAAARGGTGTALTIAALSQSEADANYDYIHGEGAAQAKRDREAKWRAEHQERVERQRKAQEEADRLLAEWEKNNPEAAARKKAEAAAEQQRLWKEEERKARAAERRAANRRTPAPRYRKATRQDSAAYYDGRAAGGSVSLDKQVDTSKPVGSLK